MGKLFSKNALVALLAALALLPSCMKDPEQHVLIVTHPTNGLLYADQMNDSLVFLTHDTYTMTPVESWIHIDGDLSHDFKYDNYKRYSIHIPVTFDENTTGKSRMGTVLVKSYDFSVYGLWVQMGHLNIQRPAAKFESVLGNTTTIPETVSFALADSSFVTQDSLCFQTYKDWSLSFAEGSEAEWISLERTSGTPGRYRVDLLMEENEAYEDRVAKLVLSSGTVKNEITVRQYAKKKPKNGK